MVCEKFRSSNAISPKRQGDPGWTPPGNILPPRVIREGERLRRFAAGYAAALRSCGELTPAQAEALEIADQLARLPVCYADDVFAMGGRRLTDSDIVRLIEGDWRMGFRYRRLREFVIEDIGFERELAEKGAQL